jgi:hypothetical protein
VTSISVDSALAGKYRNSTYAGSQRHVSHPELDR